MPYLIDADSLIQAQNGYYAIDICPGFWDWLDKQNELGEVFSIQRVAAEVAVRKDEVAAWVRRKGDAFFLPPHKDIAPNMARIGEWLFSDSVNFKQESIAKFMDGADVILIAQAMCLGYDVITEETPIQLQPKPSEPSHVKIPNVCKHFRINPLTLTDAIRATKAKFVLK